MTQWGIKLVRESDAMKHAFLKCGSAAFALMVAMPGFAQSAAPAEEEGISDIVVTAQRRSESVQDVPIAISAFSSSQLEAQGVSNTLQLGQYVPNLVAQNNTGLGSANAYFLRGLGNTESIATFDPPVGTYVDDIYISRQNGNNLSLFDVERVEVLRGPQGTLFGRNTTGGAINVIMRKPGDTISGYAEIGYGSYKKKLARASIDLPLAPTFAIKVSGYWQDDAGYVKNVTTGERMNDDDGWGARIAVRGDLAPDVRWNAAYARIVANGENTLNFDCNPVNPTQCDGRFASGGFKNGNTLSPSPFASLNISGRKANYGQGNRAESDLITSTLEGDLGEKTTVSLITGYIGLRQQFAVDFFDGRGGPSIAVPNPPIRGFARGGFTIVNDGYHQQFSQEVKLNGQAANGLLTYVVGGYYLDEYNKTDFADVFSVFTGAPGGLGLLLADRTLTNKTRALAAYAQGDIKLGPVTLTAGIRYTDERKTFDIRDNRANCNLGGALPATCLGNANLVSPSGVRIPTVQSAKLWTPRFAINVKPTDDILLFASATRGFKSGGWNARGTVNNQLLPFGPEKVWSYEAGIKSDLFDRKVRANLTFFYMDVKDLQTPSALVSATGAITFLTRNFANYRNKGIEGEFIFQPVTGMNLFANFGYQDDKYILPAGAPAVDIYGIQSVAAQAANCRALITAGNIPGGAGTAACAAGIVAPNGSIATPVRTPDWTIALGGSYKAPLGGGLSLTPSINASYRGRQEVGTSNLTIYNGAVTGTNGTFPSNLTGTGALITGSNSAPAWLFNAGLTLASESGWQLSAECTNCFDKEFVQSTLANYSYLNTPAQWMVRAKYKF
jgi:iron complex outermembrane recepter protein